MPADILVAFRNHIRSSLRGLRCPLPSNFASENENACRRPTEQINLNKKRNFLDTFQNQGRWLETNPKNQSFPLMTKPEQLLFYVLFLDIITGQINPVAIITFYQLLDITWEDLHTTNVTIIIFSV